MRLGETAKFSVWKKALVTVTEIVVIGFLIGIALAVVLNAAPSAERSRGLTLFGAQLLLNFAWSPIFFGAHLIDLALIVILLTNALVTAAIVSFWRVQPLAWALLLLYLAWLYLATALNYETGDLKPRANSHPLGLTYAQHRHTLPLLAVRGAPTGRAGHDEIEFGQGRVVAPFQASAS